MRLSELKPRRGEWAKNCRARAAMPGTPPPGMRLAVALEELEEEEQVKGEMKKMCAVRSREAAVMAEVNKYAEFGISERDV